MAWWLFNSVTLHIFSLSFSLHVRTCLIFLSVRLFFSVINATRAQIMWRIITIGIHLLTRIHSYFNLLACIKTIVSMKTHHFPVGFKWILLNIQKTCVMNTILHKSWPFLYHPCDIYKLPFQIAFHNINENDHDNRVVILYRCFAYLTLKEFPLETKRIKIYVRLEAWWWLWSKYVYMYHSTVTKYHINVGKLLRSFTADGALHRHRFQIALKQLNKNKSGKVDAKVVQKKNKKLTFWIFFFANTFVSRNQTTPNIKTKWLHMPQF